MMSSIINMSSGIYFLLIISVYAPNTVLSEFEGIERLHCKSRKGLPVRPHSEFRHRVNALRQEMRIRSSIQGTEIDAYIITSYDEHLNEEVAESDLRRHYLTGFLGSSANAVVTMQSVALWTDDRYVVQADSELDCDWKIFKDNEQPNIPTWISTQLRPNSIVGADPQTVPHFLWDEWENEFKRKFIRFDKIHQNLIDPIWKSRPPYNSKFIQVHPQIYAGEKWESKFDKLRAHIATYRADAIVITSLTEVAYMLNLRGNDLPYTPVFKAYLIVTHEEAFLYTNTSRVSRGAILHLKSQPCLNEYCVKVREYGDIWRDIRTFTQKWRRVVIPTHCVFDLGVSEAIYSAFPRHLIIEKISPVILMRAQKNDKEREGMQKAHVIDGAAMCETLSYLEEQFMFGDTFTEMSLAREVDRSRRALKTNKGISFKTIVAFGPHSSLPHFQTRNSTDIEITEYGTIIIDSGGQYLDGTTEVTRTIHLGEPTAEQKIAYTNVLRGIIGLSLLVFPENLKLAEIDTLARGAVWGSLNDYPQSTGHGIGAYLSVRESPINIAYLSIHKYTFKDGYFFTNEPGYYKPGRFGVRIENVLEVIDIDKRHPAGTKFLAFRDVTLVPFDPKLIDRSLLSTREKRWVNDYNARIRELVGDELKKQSKMKAFYWMMNKTRHIIEYYPESEYRKDRYNINNANKLINTLNTILILLIILLRFF